MIQCRTLSFLFFLTFLAGCATQPYGNYVENNSSTYSKTMADDVAQQLMLLFPPASTRFNMQHQASDSFGAALTENLRVSGYAVHDYKKTQRTAPGANLDEGTSLGYILDRSKEVYRLSVVVDEQILTRAYMPYKDAIYPAGAWTQKE